MAASLSTRHIQARPQDQELDLRRAQVAQRKAQRQKRNLELLQGSLSAKRVERQAPWLAGLHRVADGGLVATGVAAVVFTGLTLHWQNQWGVSYQQMESSQVLEHKLQESAALLEQHHLGAVKRPGWLVPTSSEKLIYLPAPSVASGASGLPLLSSLPLRQIRTGY